MTKVSWDFEKQATDLYQKHSTDLWRRERVLPASLWQSFWTGPLTADLFNLFLSQSLVRTSCGRGEKETKRLEMHFHESYRMSKNLNFEQIDAVLPRRISYCPQSTLLWGRVTANHAPPYSKCLKGKLNDDLGAIRFCLGLVVLTGFEMVEKQVFNCCYLGRRTFLKPLVNDVNDEY